MEYDNYLMHHGTKGQEWGKRHYQFPDGTWTELGKARRRAMSGAGEAARKVKKVLKKTGKVTAATIKRTRKAISDASERSRERKAVKAAKKEAKMKKLIAKAMRNNDVASILKYAPNMTNDQLLSAKTRAEYIKALTSAAPEKKKSLVQKIAADIGKQVVANGPELVKKGARLAKKAAVATKNGIDTGNKQNQLNRINNSSERFGYDELRRRQEEANSKTKRKSYSQGTVDTKAYEYNRKLSNIGKIFSDTEGYSSSGRSRLTPSDDYSDFLTRLADDYENERKKKKNNYVWHGMRTKRRRRRKR